MDVREKLASHLSSRVAEVRVAKDKGTKVVGLLTNRYVPEELVYACGEKAVPVVLIRGGDSEAVQASGAHTTRWTDTFCRAQIGYKVLKEDMLYEMVDLFVIPITFVDIRIVADYLNLNTNVEVFRLGVPHFKNDSAFEYYLEGVKLLKQKLEKLTGVEITEQALREAVDLFNRERELLREISLMRKAEQPPITAEDFVRLHHASLLADKKIMIDALESIYAELKQKKAAPQKRPRILLVGSILALGAYKILRLIDEAGGVIVHEEFSEGMRDYWEPVLYDGDIVTALADRYLRRQVSDAFFRESKERIDFLIRLAKEFNADGVIWYQTMYNACYDVESYYFRTRLDKELGLPMLKIASDYDASETEPFRTRVETFIETLRRR